MRTYWSLVEALVQVFGHWDLLANFHCELAVWAWETQIVYEVLDGGPCESLLLSISHRH